MDPLTLDPSGEFTEPTTLDQHPTSQDRTPLENHHLAAGFTLLCAPDHDFLGNLPRPEFKRVRKVGRRRVCVRTCE